MRDFPAGMTTAPGRGRARARWRWLVLATVAAAPACKLNQQGVSPPLDRIAFPASALVDPDGRWLYVANSNSDLRYNNGTLVAVDLDAATRDRFAPVASDGTPITWPVCPAADRVRPDSVDVHAFPADAFPCCWDFLDHTILNCDERLYIPPASTVKIGSFASGMAFQPFADPACAQSPDPAAAMDAIRTNATTRHECNPDCTSSPGQGRLFIGIRGNSSLTWVDTGREADPTLGTRPTFSGSACQVIGSGTVPEVCSVTETPGPGGPANMDPPIHVPDEPYALVLDQSKDLLYVGNLRGDTTHPQTGGISLFDVRRPAPDSQPEFIGPSTPFFNPDINGQFGITSLTLRDNGVLYASSRYGTNVVNVLPTLNGQCGQSHDTISLVTGSDVYTTPLVGVEIRGIQFLPDANGVPGAPGTASRAFVLQRTPPALVVFDASTDPRAFGNFPSDVLETCAGPTFLQAFDSGEGTRLYVTCFDQGQIYVFDPYVPKLVSIINAGRGPAGLAFPPTLRPDRPTLAYVVGFSANDIPVLDLSPGSPTQYHIVQRIGFPSLEPR